jgi:hypothetical protein
MAIEIVPHSAELREAVEAFNQRMRAGGSPWGMYPDPVPDWIPKTRPEQPVWREYHLALEDKRDVRGGFVLKPQPWWIRGEVRVVTDWQGPFSEGLYSAKYSMLGLRMIRDMLKRRPLLYSWAYGGAADEDAMVQMLKKIGWRMHDTPLCIRVLKPRRFLRLNRYLRTTPGRRLALDALAFSGAGPIGLHALHTGLRLYGRKRFAAARVEVVPEFGDWADDVWRRCRDGYAALAVRDSEVMNTLVPAQGWPPGHRLRIRDRNGDDVGWAVALDTPMQNDVRFGDLRVGSIIDCLAPPEQAGGVVAAATRWLAARGVDLVVSNQVHPAWVQGFRDNGYVVLPRRRLFTASPELQKAFEPFEQTMRGLHMTNLDGHGPMML